MDAGNPVFVYRVESNLCKEAFYCCTLRAAARARENNVFGNGRVEFESGAGEETEHDTDVACLWLWFFFLVILGAVTCLVSSFKRSDF